MCANSLTFIIILSRDKILLKMHIDICQLLISMVILNCIVAVLKCYSCNMTNSLEECSSQTVYCESDNEVRHTRVHFDIVIRDGFEKHKTKALLVNQQ